MSVYDPLVRMDNETYEIKPCLAEFWTTSEDGKEYTFKIKSGVKFSDGMDMTIDDVVFSLQRGMEMPMAVPSFARVVGVEKRSMRIMLRLSLTVPIPNSCLQCHCPRRVSSLRLHLNPWEKRHLPRTL